MKNITEAVQTQLQVVCRCKERQYTLLAQNQKWFAVLALTEPIGLPTNNLDEFKRQITFEGTDPAKSVR